MKTIIRIYNASKKYLFRDTKYFFVFLFRYFQENYRNTCKFYTSDDFVEQIKKGRSIIRMGDGEFGLLHFISLPKYQVYSDSIRNDFLKIIRNYNNSSKYIIMIPLFVNYKNNELKKINRFQVWMSLKVTYELIFNKKVMYFDQHIFYKDNGFKNLVLPYVLTKKIIIVTNKNNIENIKNSEVKKDIFGYVECPSSNTYESKGEVKSNIIEIINKSCFDKKDFVVLLSAGLLKTMIYKMSEDGYQVLDIGKGLESYFMGKSIEYQI